MEEELEKVREKQEDCARKYVEKAQRNALRDGHLVRRFEVGDKVLVMYKFEKHRKKTLGKGYYPYSGEVSEVKRNGKYYRVKWGRSSPPNQREGEISRKDLRWDQLILQKEGEEEELVVQFYNQADSYNTTTVSKKRKDLEKVWRQRKTEREELEILCSYKSEGEPEWEKIFDLGTTKKYKKFIRNYWERREEKMPGKQAEETESGNYKVEKLFCAKEEGRKVLVLWKYWMEPTWEDKEVVEHLTMFQEWVNSEDYIVLESESETETETETESEE